MQIFRRRAANSAGPARDSLSQLLASEQRLASELDAARAEAEQILADAREYAQQAHAACSATVDARVAEASAAHERRLTAELEDIRSKASLEVARYEKVDPGLEQELVRLLLRRIVAYDADPPRGAQ